VIAKGVPQILVMPLSKGFTWCNETDPNFFITSIFLECENPMGWEVTAIKAKEIAWFKERNETGFVRSHHGQHKTELNYNHMVTKHNLPPPCWEGNYVLQSLFILWCIHT
jgi:hypothetical protein